MVRQASSSRTEDTGLVPLCCLQGKHPPRKQFLLLASCQGQQHSASNSSLRILPAENH